MARNVVTEPLSGCIGSLRLIHGSCPKAFDFDESCGKECVCPSCGEKIIDIIAAIEEGRVREIPWWHCKPVPSKTIVIWEFRGDRLVMKIPSSYIEVYRHLELEKGKETSAYEAIQYFQKAVAHPFWGVIIVEIYPQEVWEEMYLEAEIKMRKEGFCMRQKVKGHPEIVRSRN